MQDAVQRMQREMDRQRLRLENMAKDMDESLQLMERLRERRFLTLGLNVGLSESSPDCTLTMGYWASWP